MDGADCQANPTHEFSREQPSPPKADLKPCGSELVIAQAGPF